MILASSQVQLRCTSGDGKDTAVSPCQIVSWSPAYITVVHHLTIGLPCFHVFFPNGKPLRVGFKWTLEEIGVVQHDSGDEDGA